MPGLELSPSAQQWVAVLLIWVGFGTLAGLLARMVLPFRHLPGPVATVVLGTVGSAVGLTALALWLGTTEFNPITPAGFLTACAGALVCLAPYTLYRGWAKTGPSSDPSAGDA